MQGHSRNARMMLALCAILIVMIALVAAAKPLYQLFCGATGLGGTTQNANLPKALTAKDRMITVFFDGNVDRALPWAFGPDQKSVKVHLNEPVTISYHAKNLSDHAITGMAVHNVQPDKAGLYFDKVQCFCFTKQTLNAGEAKTFPVQFFIDPSIATDPNADDVTNITLSYSFYLAKEQAKTNTHTDGVGQPENTPH